MRLINKAKRQDEEARRRMLHEAIDILCREKAGARTLARKLALPSTGLAAKLDAWLDELLDHPSRRLAVYGTLVPGEANYHVIAAIQGTWERGWVPGVLGRIGPYPAFQWKPRAKRITVHVLSSPGLPRHWARLDRFEGHAYRRVLAPITMPGGSVQVANIYEAIAVR